jgi:UDP-GlcNAc3NAcA epimerase
MLKIVTIIGARPQIIKSAALSRAISTRFKSEIQEVIVHTGQHYDANMSQVFFDELNIPAPNYNLNVGSGAHGKQTAAMIEGIEEILKKEKPHCIVLYGDTNSTLAGAVAASKIHVPVVHIEAGLRSFNKSMPEEVNRILCDHVSTLLFSPTESGVKNLEKEGFDRNAQPPYSADHPKIYHCGDVMYDNSLHFSEIAAKQQILKTYGIDPNDFILATIHRPGNTDDPERLNSIFRALNTIAEKVPVVLPLHPRTDALLDKMLEPSLFHALRVNLNILLIPPVSFLDMIALEKNAKMIITDSGGVQKEAYFFKKPCIILRPETEWIELVESGAAIIADADEKKIMNAYVHFTEKSNIDSSPIYGDGKAAEFICSEIIKTFQK